ncbi:hypothetical protein FACS189481_1170 [Clostridia bacterium]|nr:hypothetical protein FACS189481_1170 [Clostridia bacterium]
MKKVPLLLVSAALMSVLTLSVASAATPEADSTKTQTDTAGDATTSLPTQGESKDSTTSTDSATSDAAAPAENKAPASGAASNILALYGMLAALGGVAATVAKKR